MLVCYFAKLNYSFQRGQLHLNVGVTGPYIDNNHFMSLF